MSITRINNSQKPLVNDVSAVLVTRGDCDLRPVIARLPFDDIVIWDNSTRPENLKVFGRFAAIKEAKHRIIYTQDDDCLVHATALLPLYEENCIVGNMPRAQREFYDDGVMLLGWGALFDAGLIDKFDRYLAIWPKDDLFLRECDRLFTGLNNIKAAEVPFRLLERSSEPNRMTAEERHWRDLSEMRSRIAGLRGGGKVRKRRSPVEKRRGFVDKQVKQFFKKIAVGALGSVGLEIRRSASSEARLRGKNPDCTEDEWATYDFVREYTMTSFERVLALIRATKYICDENIPGDIVACGVWRGGGAMTIARTLLAIGETDRKLYLFDTFEGTSSQAEKIADRDGGFRSAEEGTHRTLPTASFGSQCEVMRNLSMAGYPMKNVILVRGPVESTIPETMPGSVALLLLDTDWYEATKHGLQHLHPVVSSRGIVLIGDYGSWYGCRKAIDEFLSALRPTFLHRVDHASRLFTKL